MKKILTAVLCLAVPGLFFLNAWQGFRTNTLADRVSDLERQQKELLSANRDIIGQIAYETSPERVAQKAVGLGLVPGGDGAAGGGFGAAGGGFGAAEGQHRFPSPHAFRAASRRDHAVAGFFGGFFVHAPW